MTDPTDGDRPLRGDPGHVRRRGLRPIPPADPEAIFAIERHVRQYVGPIEHVWHELASELVHLDVHMVFPTEDRPFATLITTGMSDRPMCPPSEASRCRYAELLIALPDDWPLTGGAFEREQNSWPVLLLERLARLPHQYGSWLWCGHSAPNGDPATPYAPDVGFTGVVLGHASTLPAEFDHLLIRAGKEVHFLAVYPVYPEEMELGLREGADELFRRLHARGYSEVVEKTRPSVG